MSIIRNIDVAGNYIHAITEDDLVDNVPLAFMEISTNINDVIGGFSKYCDTPARLLEWFGVPTDRVHTQYLWVATYSTEQHGDTNWSDHGAPSKVMATKVSQSDFRPELFPSHVPAIWLDGLTDGDILVINRKLAFKVRFHQL